MQNSFISRMKQKWPFSWAWSIFLQFPEPEITKITKKVPFQATESLIKGKIFVPIIKKWIAQIQSSRSLVAQVYFWQPLKVQPKTWYTHQKCIKRLRLICWFFNWSIVRDSKLKLLNNSFFGGRLPGTRIMRSSLGHTRNNRFLSSCLV
jgi:hypothetical protein